MKNAWKYILGIAVVVLIAGYIIFNGQNGDSNSQVAANNGGTDSTSTGSNQTTTAGGTGNGNGTTTGSTVTTSTGGTGSTGQYRNGTYTGSAADAFYGTVQVAAVVSGGKLTDVKFLKYPNEPGHTSEVSSMAIPQLKKEAIASQSATVDIVSGATQTSQAFQQSLASALSQAKS